MTSKKVSIWYDEEGDMLEVLWSFREWLIPTPLQVTPGKRGPIGAATRSSKESR